MRHIGSADDFAAIFGAGKATLGRLETYAGLLAQWQKAVNLVAPSTLDDIWHRHFADSAQLVRLAPLGARRWTDLGSGAGFPGLVVAILLAETPDARVTLVESDQRKAAFLAEVARRTGVAVDILSMRIEQFATRPRVEAIDVVSARALAPLGKLLTLAAPLFSAATVGVFPKGRDAANEVADARNDWAFACELVESVTDAAARIVVIRNPKAKAEG